MNRLTLDQANGVGGTIRKKTRNPSPAATAGDSGLDELQPRYGGRWMAACGGCDERSFRVASSQSWRFPDLGRRPAGQSAPV
jgi:hypothetical protein